MRSTPEPLLEDILTRGVGEVLQPEHLLRQAKRKVLRVKLGIDPTGYQLHLGHAVPLRKLRAFQDAGHQAVLIIGDFTAQIGDPTGRDVARTALSPEQTKKFASEYLMQAGKVLDINRTEVHYNSEWFGTMAAQDLLNLCSKFSLNQILAHDTFHQRLQKGKPVALHEIIYPVLQGYDSVMVQADVELGGMDQKFNVLAGREAQKIFNQDQQDIVLLKYIRGTDGTQKMSKTAANYIALDDSSPDMYGKLMSVPDALVWEYLELASTIPLSNIQQLRHQLKKKELHPKDLKAYMAKVITGLYYGTSDIEYAEQHFDDVHRKKIAPTDMPTITLRGKEHNLLNILVSQQLATSRTEARRLVEQGGVKIDQTTVTAWDEPVHLKNNSVLQVGKRRFVKIIIS